MAGHDVDDAGGKARRLDQLAEFEHHGRGMLRGLQDHGIAGRQRRADLDGNQKELRIPRHHGGHDAQWLAKGENAKIRLVDRQGGAVDLVGAAGVVVEELGDVLRLPARFLEHLAGVDGLGPPEVLRFVGQQVGQLAQIAAPFSRCGGGPGPLRKGAMSRPDRPVDIADGGFRDLGPGLTRRRVEALESLTVFGAEPCAVDEHPVADKVRHRQLSPLA